MTRPSELRDMGDNELLEQLEAAKEELFNLRFQMATGQLDNPMLIKQTRHDVARMLTILRDRELEELDSAETPSEAAEDAEETS